MLESDPVSVVVLAPVLKLVEREADFLKPEMLRGRLADPCKQVNLKSTTGSASVMVDGGSREGNEGPLNLEVQMVQVRFLRIGVCVTRRIIVGRRNCMTEDIFSDVARLFAQIQRP